MSSVGVCGMINKYFSRDEFACKCGCGFSAVDVDLLAVLTDVRGHFDKAVKINSACRCPAHNKAVGGEDKSMHMFGMAADFVVVGVSPAKVYQYLTGLYPTTYGLGLYKTWVHLDVRRAPARWEK